MAQLYIMHGFFCVWIGTQIPIYLTEKIHKIDTNSTKVKNKSKLPRKRYNFNNLEIRGALISSLIGILISLYLFPNLALVLVMKLVLLRCGFIWVY